MFNISNYYGESRGLPVQDSIQLSLLKLTDATTIVRELSKMGTGICLVSTATCLFFNYNPVVAISWTVVFGVSWTVTSACARKLEPFAADTIKLLQKEKDLVGLDGRPLW